MCLKLASCLEKIVLVYAYCMCPSVGSWIYNKIYCDVITPFHSYHYRDTIQLFSITFYFGNERIQNYIFL